MKKYQLAYFVSHPIQYQAPLLRKISEHDAIDLKVFFLSSFSQGVFLDKGFNSKIAWDVDLTAGYAHQFLTGFRNTCPPGWLSPIGSEAARILCRGQWSAAWFHGHANLSALAALLTALKLRIPVLFRGESTLQVSRPSILKDVLVSHIVRNSAALLWIGRANREYYEHYGARPDQLFFMPYAVDNDFFASAAHAHKDTAADMRSKLKLPADAPVILFAGKLIRRKNAHILLKAFERLHEKRQGLAPYLIIVGDGEDRRELEAQAVETGFGQFVRFVGFQNQKELPKYYSMCDLFVIPSSREPFGLVLNEVMNAGKAIIASDEVGAARDLVIEGRNGRIVRAGDSEGLSSALAQVLGRPDELAQMGTESRKIINGWSFEHDLAGLLEALDNCADRKSRR